MQWYHVEMRQDETLKVNGHLRSGSASEAVSIALGRERRWPVQEVGRDAARAIDPENPENWCKASGVKGPAWPSTKDAPEKKKAKKKATAKTPAAEATKKSTVSPVKGKPKKKAAARETTPEKPARRPLKKSA